MTPNWSHLGALTEKVVRGKQVEKEALTAWLTVRVLKVGQKRLMTARNGSGNLTDLVN